MQVKSLFINFPVSNIEKSRTFWTKLGFAINEQFSDEKAFCLVLKEGILHAMLISHEYFSTFTNRPIADKSTTQVLTALEVESRDKVDEIVKIALENGATRYRDGEDHGWMYYDCFADPDGHQWEIMYSDPSQMTA